MLPQSFPRASPAQWTAGVAWTVLSAVAQGTGAVMTRKAFATAAAFHEKIDPGTAAYQRVLGGILVAALAFLVVTWCDAEHPKETGRAWPWVLANALTGPILGVTCYQWALSTTPAGIVQPIVATSPLVTIPFAARLERTWPRPVYYLGAALAVAGVAGRMIWR